MAAMRLAELVLGGKSPRRGVAAVAAAGLLLSSAGLAACGNSTADPAATTTAPQPNASGGRPAPSGSNSKARAAARKRAAALAARRARQAARADIARVVRSVPAGAAGVAALDVTTGTSVVAGSHQRMWTASMYKLLVLETLLREDGPLSGYQLDEAERMIEQSDNAAGWDLWLAGGSNSGLEQTMHDLGMRHSVADGPDPTFTELTPADALRMVRALVRPGVLSPAARRQAIDLMRHVESDQRWGVGVVADPGTDFANKNGWLAVDNGNGAGFDDDDRWIVTSVGIVTVSGHEVLMAAMTNHEDTEPDGIRAVQRLAKAAVVLLGDG
jgi:beta-lactamase class A